MEDMKTWKPKRWLAILLSLFLGCSGMLYAGRGKLYVLYNLLELLVIAVTIYLVFDHPTLDLLDALFSVCFIINIVCAIHTYKLFSNFKQNGKRPWYSHWWGIVGIYFSILMSAFLFRSFFYEPFHTPSGSMAPTFEPGDHVVISKLGFGNYGSLGIKLMHTTPSKKVQRGDVIVFEYPPNPKLDYIKRVIGLPGDVVSYKSKQLQVNNQPVSRKLIGDYTQPSPVNTKEYEESLNGVTWHIINTSGFRPPKDFTIIIPPDSYFVMGDNRDNSLDSRFWGTVPAKNIKGKVIYSTSGKM